MAAEGSHSNRDLRIVLLGNGEAGKSSAGNIILCGEEFDPDVRTLQCVTRQGLLSGRRVTVVDTPGWNDCNRKNKRDTPNLLKREIKRSVVLCSPGPHVILLVIHENMTFTEMERNATSNHLSLLGHEAWKHSLVLFIQETPTEEKAFEVKGKMRQWLVDKCNNRYHVLSVKNKDITQVTELLEKIDDLVAGNKGLHFEMEREKLEEIEEMKKKEEESAEERRKNVQRQRESLRSLRGTISNLQNIRIVLLGYEQAGKSSSGNTILGREEFEPKRRTAQCVKRQGEVAGRGVTVVEAPGWFRHCPTLYTTDFTKSEIMLSQGLCSEGPHCFLLAIRVDAHFSGGKHLSIWEHLNLLGLEVWSHTIVLFTHGDWLGDTTIEQYIESEGEQLQRLLERCGNRYHVINNKEKDGRTQVTQLLEKIEEMVAENNGCHYEVDQARHQKVTQWNKEVKDRAKIRRMENQGPDDTERNTLLDGKNTAAEQAEPLGIILLGCKSAGKTSARNTILGQKQLEMCGSPFCVKTEGEVAGRKVTLVEAPGWKNILHFKDAPSHRIREIKLSMSLCPPGPNAVLLVIYVSAPFTNRMKNATFEHMKLLGSGVWKHTMVLFTYGDWLGDTTIEEYIESEPELQSVIEECGNRYHVLDNSNRGDVMQVTDLLKKVEKIMKGNGGRHYETDQDHLENLIKEKKQEEERAKDRRIKVVKKIEHLQSLKSYPPLLSEVRIVLFGCTFSGKSSSGNTILGRKEFDLKRTVQCVKKQGKVLGQQVTVVEAPGWCLYFWLEDTPELIKQEIALSMSQCHPGPHAVIIVIDVENYLTEEKKNALVEHLELVGRVWDHTMVLFTCGDLLGDTTIEQYIESEGEPLQTLVEKCGNRYHVFENLNKGDHTQVAELMEKINEMVNENGCRHYEMDREKIQELEQKKAEQKQRAEDHMANNAFQSALGQIKQPELRIVLIGFRNGGKCASGNTILGREDFDLKRKTPQCVRRHGIVEGRRVTVVKAPGWFKRENKQRTPSVVLEGIKQSVDLCSPGPHAVLLVIRLSGSFTENIGSTFLDHVRLLGDNVWNHAMVLFTCGDCLGDNSVEHYIEAEGEGLTNLLKKCGNRYHVLNNKDMSDRTQITELLKKIEMMVDTNNGHQG